MNDPDALALLLVSSLRKLYLAANPDAESQTCAEFRAVGSTPAGSDIDSGKEPQYDDPCWHLYSYRSIYKDAGSTRDGYLDT